MEQEIDNILNKLAKGTDSLKSFVILPFNALIVILSALAIISIIGLIAVGLCLVVAVITVILILTIIANIIMLPFKLLHNLLSPKQEPKYIDAEIVK